MSTELYPLIIKERLFNLLVKQGYICAYGTHQDILDELVGEGLALNCREFPHGVQGNPHYTYVTNDNRGKETALRLYKLNEGGMCCSTLQGAE